MSSDSRMTVRLDPASRRKVERLAAAGGLSLNAALNRLLRRAPDDPEPPSHRPAYRLKPRKTGFGFEIADARRLATAISDDRVLEARKGRR